ncbi:hypothetical protein F0U61_41410 [Archangium violaceum]|uniref:hypothetical protein n=1 Tax=Archangium violaceum TaxID=83451 RepID=UPI002B29EB0B|nr:hypothetical protein F0U61_41410 [Archangium violaceum]
MSEQDKSSQETTPDVNTPAVVKPSPEKAQKELEKIAKDKELEKIAKDKDKEKEFTKDRKDAKEKELTKDRKDAKEFTKDRKDTKDAKEKELTKDRKDLLEKAAIQDKGVPEKDVALEKLPLEKDVALEKLPLEKAVVEVDPKNTEVSNPSPMEARMERLEQTVAQLAHFIDPQLRPNLGASALASEADAEEKKALSQQLEKNARDAKQAKDAKDTEKPRES